MFNENLKALRKQKGYSQEELAIKLNVVRQTVSKWEKGLSVPDVEMLQNIADILECDISQLLDKTEIINENNTSQAEQLAKIAEQMAIKNQRQKKIGKTIKTILIGILVIVLILSGFTIAGLIGFNFNADSSVDVVNEEYVNEIEGNP
ncbi:MAG: helix-turn-helix domain-containing protein [Ruminococcus sp.]|nr:helix-turn-helix domain-containing protein [Ruminococcus sp.]